MDTDYTPYDTFSDWLLTRLLDDMAACPETQTNPLGRYLTALYADMRENPGAYAIPHEPIIKYMPPARQTDADKAEHEERKAARNRVRKAVYASIDFLYQLGLAGAPSGDDLTLPRAAFDRVAADGVKKWKNRGFLAPLERLGLTFSTGDPVVVSNPRYPGMAAELARFSPACSPSKEFGLYLFRRGDFGVYQGKAGPDFADILTLAPQAHRNEIAETDRRLLGMKFKREIFVGTHDTSYRVRYGKKGDQIVYWLHIKEPFSPDMGHFARWQFGSEITTRLFDRLDETHPGMADGVFEGIQLCDDCYGPGCMAKEIIRRDGMTKAVCREPAWNHIGLERQDYEKLWTVIETLDSLI